ncbi:J domain-containing protein [Floridanema aerugineum]|uniref:J domain-containing protein n=1 Tax=Floridaenema aerugineum BLCC-F46 TaxID=3153654 RepID=A0ABV4X2B1_9CYAN
MTTQELLVNELGSAANSHNYRRLQKALKAYRQAGYRVSVKLNSKKFILEEEAIRLYNDFWYFGGRQQKQETSSDDQYTQWYEELKRQQAEQQARYQAEQARKEAEQQAAQAKASKSAQEYDRYFGIITSEWGILSIAGMTWKEIYRKLSKKYHPDVTNHPTEAMQALNNIAEARKVNYQVYCY